MSEEELLNYINKRHLTNKQARMIFMAQDPHCHWCGVKVLEYDEIKYRGLKKGEKVPNDMATVDHVHSRFEPNERYKNYDGLKNRVLACYKCNQKRIMDIWSKNKDNNRRKLLKDRPKNMPRCLYLLRIGKLFTTT